MCSRELVPPTNPIGGMMLAFLIAIPLWSLVGFVIWLFIH